ncbi:MAG: Mbeg1-like protein, partial [Candidatus Fimadaptatus sp.]|nr:Mbeg1-like protein [Candidatus Fimadaptatus sp.]
MQNIIDYLDWRGDVPFSAAPFNPVDNLILSQFSYISLDGIAPGTMREIVSELIKLGRVHDNNLKLSKRLAESRRFGSARVSHSMELFDPKLEMQFGALVVDTDDGATCVAFRGTDATLVGWKEDLNMSFSEEVPSQGAAVQFLNDGLRENTRPLRVMGHSKGGNLAVYASAMCRRDVQ